MAIVRIGEFDNVARTNYGATPLEALGSPVAVQAAITIPTDASTASGATLSAATNYARIIATGDCLISVDATATPPLFEFFPAGTIEVRKVKPSGMLAVKAFS